MTDVIKVGGMVRFSLLDYPGAISAVVFCQGCPNRCVYCHNPEFQDYRKSTDIQFGVIERYLAERKGLIDAVVFSGGEPLVQRGLSEAITYVKGYGYKVGLHTSGISEEALKMIIGCIDWIGLDIKAPPKKYKLVAGNDIGGEAYKCLDMILRAGTAHEVRTTYDSSIMNEEDLKTIIDELGRAGEKAWVIQRCNKYKNNRIEMMSGPSGKFIQEARTHIDIRVR